MKRRRVKITGIGPVTPAGIGREDFWRGIQEATSRVRPYTRLPAELGAFVAATVEGFNPDKFVQKARVPKGAARHTLFAIVGAILALRDAGLNPDDAKKLNPVVVAGACVMDFDGIVRTIQGTLLKGAKGAQGRTVYSTNAATIAATVGQVLELDARSMSVQSSCCTGLDSIGFAARMISEGESDVAICGGTDAPLYRTPLVELRSVGMTPSTSENAPLLNRPFDLWRTTGVVSEGACMFVLEPESSPRPGFAFVDGYAFANDSEGDLCGGLGEAMRLAVAGAQLANSAIETISAWGPGHRLVDEAECRQIESVFGDRFRSIPAVSIKGSIGNPLGAAPAIQVAAAVMSMRCSAVLPTVNWVHADPACPLNLSRKLRHVDHDNALVNAHGLSGVNSALVLTKC